jgi:hypothetical protein
MKITAIIDKISDMEAKMNESAELSIENLKAMVVMHPAFSLQMVANNTEKKGKVGVGSVFLEREIGHLKFMSDVFLNTEHDSQNNCRTS